MDDQQGNGCDVWTEFRPFLLMLLSRSRGLHVGHVFSSSTCRFLIVFLSFCFQTCRSCTKNWVGQYIWYPAAPIVVLINFNKLLKPQPSTAPKQQGSGQTYKDEWQSWFLLFYLHTVQLLYVNFTTQTARQKYYLQKGVSQMTIWRMCCAHLPRPVPI